MKYTSVIRFLLICLTLQLTLRDITSLGCYGDAVNNLCSGVSSHLSFCLTPLFLLLYSKVSPIPFTLPEGSFCEQRTDTEKTRVDNTFRKVIHILPIHMKLNQSFIEKRFEKIYILLLLYLLFNFI
jgi:hypothetical protein